MQISRISAVRIIRAGYITAPFLFAYDVIMAVYYLNNHWWVYALLSFLGLILGIGFSRYAYTYVTENNKTYRVVGFPFPFILPDEIFVFPFHLGVIFNPLYIIMLVNAVYLTAQLLFGDGIIFAIPLLLPLVVFWLNKHDYTSSSKDSSNRDYDARVWLTREEFRYLNGRRLPVSVTWKDADEKVVALLFIPEKNNSPDSSGKYDAWLWTDKSGDYGRVLGEKYELPTNKELHFEILPPYERMVMQKGETRLMNFGGLKLTGVITLDRVPK